MPAYGRRNFANHPFAGEFERLCMFLGRAADTQDVLLPLDVGTELGTLLNLNSVSNGSL